MGNPKCLKCSNQPNYKGGSDCTCNDEVRCASCDDCTWCINKNMNGKCVENSNASKHRCVNLRDSSNSGLSKEDMYIIVGCVSVGVILITVVLMRIK